MENSGEFMAKEFATYYVNEGTQRHFSAPYMPRQNGDCALHDSSVVEGKGDAHAILERSGDHYRVAPK
jgi:hypothetical protein